MTEEFLQELPAPQEELLTTSGQLEEMRQYQYRHASKSNISYTYDYSLLSQSQQRLYLPPDKRPIDREEFLCWGGDDTLICRYHDQDDSIYEPQREDGTYWMITDESETLMHSTGLDQFVLKVCLLVAAVGGTMLLPAWFCFPTIRYPFF